MNRTSYLATTLALAMGTLATAGAVQAQDRQGRIEGVVVDQNTGDPVGIATLMIEGRSGVIRVNSDGRFTITRLGRGTYVLVARALGYDSTITRVPLDDNETKQVLIGLYPFPQVLPEVTVDERARRPVGRLAAVEERMRQRRGQFVTQDEIQQRRAPHLGTILGGLSGVNAICNGMECIVRMSRSPRNCPPAYYLDGIPNNGAALDTPLHDIYVVEVYRGPGETPSEFSGSMAGCGVVAIWTRSAASRP